MKKFLFLFFFSLIVFYSCYKDEFENSGSATLYFSSDSVIYDTIFTQIGSVTRQFKVYNQNNKSLKIQTVQLQGGELSPFGLNVNGKPGKQFANIEIPAGDSIYIFVEVKIDPLNSNLPLLVEDAVQFNTNGNKQLVHLLAFGQDVHLLDGEILKTQTWNNAKPYLIYNNAALDTGETLTITEGTQVFLHANSSLLIYGTLNIDGTYANPVVFTGDRTDGGYAASAGQWGTIYFDPDSKNNTIHHAVIKNAVAGLQVGFPGDQENRTDLKITNTIIQNASFAGIYTFYSEIEAYNTVVADCGTRLLAIFQGGKYNFMHCTFSNNGAYYSFDGNEGGYTGYSGPAISMENSIVYYNLDRHLNIVFDTFFCDLEAANFYNCIITGIAKEEIALHNTNGYAFNYLFKNSIVKYKETNREDTIDVEDPAHFQQVFFNEDPLFVNDSLQNGSHNFNLDSLSPAIDSGDVELVNSYPELKYDFEGKLRLQDGKPDLGAFERQP